jgi:hypothetical protein
MKLCFFIVGHTRLECYAKQAVFYNKFKHIKDYHIIIYENSGASLEDIEERTKDFNNKVQIICQKENLGYHLGQLTALNECYDLLKDYDYVIHHTWDSFFVDDGRLNDWLVNFKVHTGCGLLTNQFLFDPRNNRYVSVSTICYGTDVFVFDPKILNKTFWETCLSYGNIPPELIIYKATKQLNILVVIWERLFVTNDNRTLCAPSPAQMDNNHYRNTPYADTMSIMHTHNLNTLDKYI